MVVQSCTWCLVPSPSLACYIGIPVSLFVPLNHYDVFELIISEHSNSPVLAFNSSFTFTAYCSALQNHICQGKWKKAQREEENIGCLPVCVVAYKLNSIVVQLKSSRWSTNRVKLGYGNAALKKESNLRTPWNWEGMDFAIVRLKKQTVIPCRDKKESQRSASLKRTVNTVQSKSNWWESCINY